MLLNTVKILFVLSVGAFASFECYFEQDFYKIQKDDRVIYAEPGVSKDVVHANGSLWVRRTQGDGGFLCYRPEKSLKRGKKERCFAGRFKDVIEHFHSEVVPFLRILNSSPPRFNILNLLSWRFSAIPQADVECAFVSKLKGALSQEAYQYDGVLHPEFSSWARYVTECVCCPSDKVIVCAQKDGRYESNSVWIRREGDRSILCYKPEWGPGWMCYRFDLEANNSEWPKSWSSVLVALQEYAQSNQTFDDVFLGQECCDVAFVVQAVLSGRGALWNEHVWFVWRPLVHTNDSVLRVRAGDTLLDGGTVCTQGGRFYLPGSAWVTLRDSAGSALRYYSQGNAMLQFSQKAMTPQCVFAVCGTQPLDQSDGNTLALLRYGERSFV